MRTRFRFNVLVVSRVSASWFSLQSDTNKTDFGTQDGVPCWIGFQTQLSSLSLQPLSFKGAGPNLWPRPSTATLSRGSREAL